MEVFQFRPAAPGMAEITASTSTGAEAAAAAAGVGAAADACAAGAAGEATAPGAGATPAALAWEEAAWEPLADATAGCEGGKILARMLPKMLMRTSCS